MGIKNEDTGVSVSSNAFKRGRHVPGLGNYGSLYQYKRRLDHLPSVMGCLSGNGPFVPQKQLVGPARASGMLIMAVS